jgi:hypothetical protein
MKYATLRHKQSGELVTVFRGVSENYVPEEEGWPEHEYLGEHEEWRDVEAEWVDGVGLRVPIPIQRQRLRDHVNFIRDTLQDNICSTPAGVVQCDEKSKTKINGLVLMATLAKSNEQSFSVEFTKADNSRVTLDADGMIALGVAVGNYVSACHERATALKEEIEAASSQEELELIDLDSGWPEEE